VERIFEATIRPGGNEGTAIASRLAFDQEGFLYFTVGDRQWPIPSQEAHVSQDLTTHMGKTIRLHDDGRVPADNPFVGRPGALPEIWSYGHRNAQGMAFHPETGALWQSESGADGGDELNVIRSGANYGWPVIGFGRQYSGQAAHQGTAREGMEQPVHHWSPALVPSGIAIYMGDRFPNWKGNVFVAGLGGQRLVRVIVDGDRFVGEESLLEGVLGRVRDVREGPDGYIYIAVDGGLQGTRTPLIRLEPI
jgi:glucose/arabinose dehydrogenase